MAIFPSDSPEGCEVNPFGKVILITSLLISFTTNPNTVPQSRIIIMDLGAFSTDPIFPRFTPVGLFVNEFPKSNKVPDARLKMAMINYTQGKSAQARKELQGIKKQYPGTTAAQLASIQLQQLASGAK